MVLASISAPWSSGRNGPVPVVPVTEVLAPMWLPINSAAPWLDVRVTPAWNVFDAQPSSPGSPNSTKPVAPEIFTLLPTVVPQIVIDPGLVAVMLPPIVEFVRISDDPAGTVRLPPMLAPEMDVDPEPSVTLPPDEPWVWSVPMVVIVTGVEVTLDALSAEAVAVLESVPVVVSATWATTVKVAEAFAGKLLSEQVTVLALLPQVQPVPVVCDADTKLVPDGRTSVIDAFTAGTDASVLLTVTV